MTTSRTDKFKLQVPEAFVSNQESQYTYLAGYACGVDLISNIIWVVIWNLKYIYFN